MSWTMASISTLFFLAVILYSSTAQDTDGDFDLVTLLQRNRESLRRSRTSSVPSTVGTTSTTKVFLEETTPSLDLIVEEQLRNIPSLLTPTVVSNSSSGSQDAVVQIETRQQRRKRLERELKNTIRKVLRSMLPYVMNEDNRANVSGRCLSSLMKVIQGIQRLKLWAFTMLDATGKLPAGLISGSMTFYGAFDQCLEVEVHNRNGAMDFQGKYCTLEIGLPPSRKQDIPKNASVTRLSPLPPDPELFDMLEGGQDLMYFMSYRIGVCIPSKCTAEDIGQIAQQVVKSMQFHASVPHCYLKEPMKINAAQITMICVIVVLVLLTLAGTAIDLLHSDASSPVFKMPSNAGAVTKYITAFSLCRNFPKLISTETSQQTLACLHGIKLFTILYVALCHTHVWIKIQPASNLQLLQSWFRDYSYEIFHNGWMSVDSFFYISGLLLTYNLLKRSDENKSQGNIFFHTILRYIRLTPTLMFVTGVAFFLPWVSSGPFWEDMVGKDLKACHKSWWINLLYISNFLQLSDICLHHTWYVSSDLQLFILGFLIFYILRRKTVIGFCTMFLTSLAGILAVAAVNYVNQFPPTARLSIPNEKLVEDVLSKIHLRPFTHIGPYCLGMLVGYLLVRRANMKISPVVQIVMWCVGTFSTLSSLLGIQSLEREGFSSDIVSAVYASLSRIGWTIGVAWVSFACITGRGGPVAAILSFKPLIPFSRLTYCAYLVQGFVMWTRYGSLREPFYASHYNLIYEYFGHLGFMLILALVCHLLVESPFANISRLVFFGDKEKDNKKEDDKFSLPRGQPVQLKSLVLSNDYVIARNNKTWEMADNTNIDIVPNGLHSAEKFK